MHRSVLLITKACGATSGLYQRTKKSGLEPQGNSSLKCFSLEKIHVKVRKERQRGFFFFNSWYILKVTKWDTVFNSLSKMSLTLQILWKCEIFVVEAHLKFWYIGSLSLALPQQKFTSKDTCSFQKNMTLKIPQH